MNTNYVEFRHFEQTDLDTRCAYVTSVYDTYCPDPMPGSANPYKEYVSEFLPKGTDFRALPGSMHHFIMYEGLEAAFEAHAQAVKDGFTEFTGALITPALGMGTRIEWQMTKPVKQQREELAQLHKLVKQRYEQELFDYNTTETERQVELRVAAIKREEERAEQARLQAIREQALAELQEAYQ